MSNTTPQQLHHLYPNPAQVDCLCIGSGRFLRSVLVPALVAANLHPAIIQTRGRSFLDSCLQQQQQQEERDAGDDDTSLVDTNNGLQYEVDTVEQNGAVTTQTIKVHGAGTLGSEKGKKAVMTLLSQMNQLQILGVGVTEAGLSSSTTKAMYDLADILIHCHDLYQQKQLTLSSSERICIINTDNVPQNGNVMEQFIKEIISNRSTNGELSEVDAVSFLAFLEKHVSFHNTMVDRITSQREGSNGMVPRCEPVPAKALVIEDLKGSLPTAFLNDVMKKELGVHVRTKEGDLLQDIALKLRVANGTHTAIAHVLALCKFLMTDVLATTTTNNDGDGDSTTLRRPSTTLMAYLDSLFQHQILPGATESFGSNETSEVYDDWRKRLVHEHFGLSSFFITQNGAAKFGIRLGVTIRDLMEQRREDITCASAFALAAILRFLTPLSCKSQNGIYQGWLDGHDPASLSLSSSSNEADKDDQVPYADGLSYNLKNGTYEFRCACQVNMENLISPTPLPEVLAFILSANSGSSQQPHDFEEVIRSYLVQGDGGNLENLAKNPITRKSFDTFVQATATLYARMISGDRMMHILEEMVDKKGVYEANGLATKCEALVDGVSLQDCRDIQPLHFRGPSPIPDTSNILDKSIGSDEDTIRSTVFSEVSTVTAIDLHTHLLPPSHGALCLWGIDELLTYHYLVAEYFMTAPPDVKPEEFYAQSKQVQATMIWKALFVDRSPVSEACRGVITTLQAFGLQEFIQTRDLEGIRNYFYSFGHDCEGAERFCESVFQLAGIQYCVMTNIPFDPTESQHWRPKPKKYSKRFRTALRVDPLLAGDRQTIETALVSSGYSNTSEGVKSYLHDWCETLQPEYMMASTPHNFTLPEEEKGTLSGVRKTGVNEEVMKRPFAFAEIARSDLECNQDCGDGEDGVGSVIDENSDFLTLLMQVCEERNLAVALKIGAHRGVNPKLLQAGDGVVAFADAGVLARLCSRFPNVRFLATFLSRNNQHEACVLASKFRNLHIYGCWWFCNNPSMIREITTMRVEMLGTAFTAQHSDSRVIDQLIYKWSHSRGLIAEVLTKEYLKLLKSGWTPTRRELRRDVWRLFGNSYEEFLSKIFKSTE